MELARRTQSKARYEFNIAPLSEWPFRRCTLYANTATKPWVTLLTVFFLFAAASTHARDAAWLPAGFTATFELETLGARVGETRWQFSRDGELLNYQSTSEPAGLYALIRDETIVESARLRASGNDLIALNYQYRRTGGKRDRFVEVAFDWANKRVRNTAKGQTWEMDVPTGALDKFSYLLAVMRDLQAGEKVLEYKIADGGKLKHYELDVLAEERIETRFGVLEALKLRRKHRSKRQTTLWCAKALGFLPVRVEHREKDGSVLTLTVQAVSGFTTP